jgi:class 3 adenylate cyclase
VTVAQEGSERRQLTVLFTDLVGSTELASALDPEDWHEVLNAYQHRVAASVTAHGGVIAQFQGDGAVAYFGYPEAQESASRDACSAALAIVEDIVRLGQELPAELRVDGLQARAGIHTGEVLIAAVTAGGNERLPDLWGQVPNMAARLQGAGEPGQVVISGNTAELVAGFFELAPLGALSLKGIADPVSAYLVVQRSGARNRLEARPLTTFIPRTEDWAWLEAQWHKVGEGRARLALVSGEPGIGKSRLLLEYGALRAERGDAVSWVFCSRRGALSPLQPFGEVMGAVPATPQDAATWVSVQTSRRGPMLLIVEDAHWADPSTLEAVHSIARAKTPVLVLMSARPEIADDPNVNPDAQLALDGLGHEDALEMLERLPEAQELKPDLREELVRRADGIPLFLEELARGVAEGSALTEGSLPTTLSEVITARLDRLGDTKRVAQAAAVVGRSFDRSELLAATALDDLTLDASVRRLVEHAIIEDGLRPDELQFRHALFHEASYRSVLRADRVRIHGAVGDMLVTSGRAGGRPEIAAFHLGAAGRGTEAVPLWKQAAHTARMNARFQEAAGHEREVLALLGQLPEEERDVIELKSRSRLVMCLTAVDQSAPEALEESRRVEELARQLGDREILLRNYMILVPWWQASAEYGTINQILVEARRVAEELGNEWTLQLVESYEATTSIWQGMVAQGLEQSRASYAASGMPLEWSLRELPPLRSVELMAVAAPRVAAALASWLCGYASEAWRIANDVLLTTTERNVPQAQAVAAVTAAIMAQLDGEREMVSKLCSEALHVADEMSTRQWRQWARSLQWWAGDGIEEPELPGPLLGPYFQMLLADDPRVDSGRALVLLDDAVATSRRTGERFCEPEIMRVRARRQTAAGRMSEAQGDLHGAVSLARSQGSRMLELRALTTWANMPDHPERIVEELRTCVAEVATGGPSRSLDEARAALEQP